MTCRECPGMVAFGVPPRQNGPDRKKDRVLLLRVPNGQRHDRRRRLPGGQNDGRHGIASAHAICPS
jgi:hypothetical protein